MQRILVIAVQSWEIKDDNKKGITVNYIDPTITQDDDKTLGIKPLKATLEQSDMRKFTFAPGIYDAEFGMKANGKGKVELVLVDVKPIREYTFNLTDTK